MTRIIFDKNRNELLVAGHADDARVCAGISALCIALDRRLCELKSKTDSFENNGEYRVRIRSEMKKAAEAMRTVIAGLKELARLYPENVQYEEV